MDLHKERDIMKVGDLVRHRVVTQLRGAMTGVGIVLEIKHAATKMPDYRTPTTVLVFYGKPRKEDGQMKQEIWFHKNELELVR